MSKSKVYHSNRGKGFFLEHARRESPYLMQSNHYHTQFEIYYLVAGDRNYFIQDRVFNLKKGDLILVNTNVLHRSVDGFSDFHERILIEFDGSFFEDFLVGHAFRQFLTVFNSDCSILHMEEFEKKIIENYFFKMIQESKENNIDDNLALKVLFLELLLTLNKYQSRTTYRDFDHPSKLHKKISEVITFINRNYDKDIGLDYVAEAFDLSKAHLSRAFKKVTGFTFIEYLNNLRIHEAQKLLADNSLNIAEIAEKVGYQSSIHFGRVFKLITGSTPRDYRKLL